MKLCVAPHFQSHGDRMTLSSRYTGPAIALHWLVAAGISANILLIWVTWALSDDNPSVRPIIDMHKSIGITVLGLAIMRLLWRATHTPPAFPAGYVPWERRAAHAAHWILYGLIFAMPLSGWLHDSAWKDAAGHPLKLFWVIPWFRIGAVQNLDPATKETLHGLFGQIHTSLSYVLYAMFAVHVAGALKHQFFDKAPELQRMWPGS
jgi:cytochrome b561